MCCSLYLPARITDVFSTLICLHSKAALSSFLFLWRLLFFHFDRRFSTVTLRLFHWHVCTGDWDELESPDLILLASHPPPLFVKPDDTEQKHNPYVRAEVYICNFQFLNATSLDNTAPNAHKRIYSKLCSSLTKRQLCQLFCGTRKLRRISAGRPTLPLYVFKLYLKWKQSKNKGQTRHTQMLGVVPLSPCKEVFYTLLITVELADMCMVVGKNEKVHAWIWIAAMR